MARDVTDMTPIGSRDELVAWFEAGMNADRPLLIGTEHEKFPFYLNDLSPVPYDGPRGIRALLEGVRSWSGWAPILDKGHLIGLYDEAGGGAISLEPGGQFELSGAPVSDLHATAAELAAHLDMANRVAAPLGIGFLGLGHAPTWSLAQTPVMPKSRYRIMADYMPKVGSRGLDMMFRTSTVQVNLDFRSEADMVRKLRVSLALQPIATALFANSPFTEGRLNGLLSMRSEIWRDTDRNRTGMMPFAFEDGMGFEAYTDYALQVPMYFVKRGETYHDVAGASFQDLLEGRLPQLPGERATLSDWANHLSTIFPEVRLKRYLEMRGADAGSPAHMVALSALFVGLLYDDAALDEAWQLVKSWSAQERQSLRDEVPRLGLSAKIAGRSAGDVARDVLAIARRGLGNRGKAAPAAADETGFLDYIDGIVFDGRNPAERLIARYETQWNQRIEPIFTEARL